MSGKRRTTLTVLVIAAALLSASMLAPAFGAPKAVSAVSLTKKLAKTLTIAKRADRNAKRAIKGLQTHGPAGPPGAAGAAGPAGAPGVNGTAGDKGDKGDSGAPATRLWAVINANGTVARGSGIGAGTFREDTGIYDVFFNRDVSDCAYVGSLGGADAGTPPGGTVGATNLFGAPKGLFVIIRNSAGSSANLPFHLAVFC
ncbi:MAG: hypothetical protein ABI611_14685 [Solirubrobacteraceae bacterium]